MSFTTSTYSAFPSSPLERTRLLFLGTRVVLTEVNSPSTENLVNPDLTQADSLPVWIEPAALYSAESYTPEVTFQLDETTHLEESSPAWHTQARQLSAQYPSTLNKTTKSAWLRKIGHKVALGVIGISAIVMALIVTPSLYYVLFPSETIELVAQTDGTPLGGQFESPAVVEEVIPPYQPPVDPSLPEGSWISIPRIGVRTELQETATPEEAMDTGVWLVPEFGDPGDKNMPMIVAAHRYGWQWWWQTDYWRYHSFYLLPELELGDTVEVIADQKKWIYEIYAGEEGEEITDYHADLILYTCKYLNSPIRHFRYARLIDPTQDTQGQSW